MTPKHITVDPFACMWEVTDMFDRHGRPTIDPALASTCVLKIGSEFIEQDADDIPIYTVH